MMTSEETDEETDLEQKKADKNVIICCLQNFSHPNTTPIFKSQMFFQSSPVPLTPSGQQSYSDKLKLDNDRKSKSPELSLDQSSKILSREKHTDSSDDLIQGPNKINFNCREIKENSHTNANKGRRTEGKNDNKRILQRSDGRMKLEEKVPVLKLTEQDFHNDERDQRLIPRYRLTDKKSSQDGNRTMKPSENKGLVFDRLRKHLLQTAEICHNRRTSSVALNYQWGTAIKVGTSNQTYNTRFN